MNFIENPNDAGIPILTPREVTNLLPGERNKIVNLLGSVFTRGEDFTSKLYNNSEFVKCVIAEVDSEIVGFASITKRAITHAGQDYIIGGFGDLVTDPKLQGQGLGLSISRVINGILVTDMYDIGMGFCNPDLVSFYSKTGWIKKEEGRVFTTRDGVHQDKGTTVLYVTKPTFCKDSFWFHDDIYIGSSGW